MGIGPSSANQKVKATRAFSKATPRPEKQTASNEFSSFFFFFFLVLLHELVLDSLPERASFQP